MTTDGGDRDQVFRALGLVTGIGVFFAACVALGLGLGLVIARFVGGGTLVVAAGFVIGALAGGRGVYRMVMRETQDR